MKKKENKISSNQKIVIAIIIVLALIGGVGAKYLLKFSSDKGKVTADKFYFTTDLLGDQTMIAAIGENASNYRYEDIQKGEWHLYGGGAHDISFQVRNFADEKRVTKTKISYTANVEAKKSDGSVIQNLATIQKSGETGQNTNAAVTSTLAGEQSATDSLVLSIKSSNEISYDEGTEVVVTITSTSPYKKTMEFHFKLYTVDTYLRYEVKDSVDSPYAELFIMTNIVDGGNTGSGGVRPWLQWSDKLSIDNTNSLTYGKEFDPVDGIESRNMQISQQLKAGESESIYFFKSDPKENYSQEEKIVEPAEDGKYIIKLGIGG